MILKIHGDVDRDDGERDTFVITEDHYIDYLAGEDVAYADPGLPDGAAARERLPLPRLLDARLEPAGDPAADLGGAGLSTGGWAIQREPERARQAVLGAAADRDPRRRRSRTGSTGCASSSDERAGASTLAAAPRRPRGARRTRASCRTPRPTRTGSSAATTWTRGRRRQPARVPAHGALRRERRRQELAAARRRRPRGSATRRARTSPSSARRGCCRSSSRPWSLDDPLAALKDAIAQPRPRSRAGARARPADGLARRRRSRRGRERVGGPLLLVLDQFEEYFLYHGRRRRRLVRSTSSRAALRRRDPPCNFLLSIREDSLAKLDRFKGRVPGLLDNLLRIDHLDRDAAREAIVRPLERWNARRDAGEDRSRSSRRSSRRCSTR